MKTQIALNIKKSLLTGIFAFGTLLVYSQKPSRAIRDGYARMESDTMHVILSGNAAIDNAIKIGFDKYWTISKFKYEAKNSGYNVYFSFSTLETRSGLNFSEISINLKNTNSWDVIYENFFDNIKVLDKNQIMGMDKNDEFISARLVQYIMLMNAELKRQKEMGVFPYDGFKGLKSNIKNKTVLVQKEYFENGISSEILNELLFKTQLISTGEIKQTVISQKGTENLAQLVFYASYSEMSAFVIDLKTGDLLNYAKIQKDPYNGSCLSEKTMKKLVKLLNAKME